MSDAGRRLLPPVGEMGRKKFKPDAEEVGDPFPNFGSTKVVCKCTYDGKEFFMSEYNEMHIVNYNGSFGTSSLTFRGLSYGDMTFLKKTYYKKKMRQGQQLVSERTWVPSGPVIAEVRSLDFGEPTPNKLNIQVESSKSEISLVDTAPGNVQQTPAQRLMVKQKGASKIRNCTMEDMEDEKLILMPEEAIFLSFAIGCLQIYNPQGQPLTCRQCWSDILKRDPDFPVRYAVYHCFRGKNWIPKSGHAYGASYVIYEGTPTNTHSTYTVYVLDSRKPKPTFRDIAAWVRVATNVRKQPLLVEVIIPEDFRPKESGPRSIFELEIREMPFNRWNPVQHNRT